MNDYQTESMRTAHRLPSFDDELAVAALGLAGEAGEFAERVKKYLAQGHDLDFETLVEELGDIMWYVAYASHIIGYNLACVSKENIIKLRNRYPEGFEAERSINRED